MEELDLKYMKGFIYYGENCIIEDNCLYKRGGGRIEIFKIVYHKSDSIIYIWGNSALLVKTFTIDSNNKNVIDSIIRYYKYNKRKQIVENL